MRTIKRILSALLLAFSCTLSFASTAQAEVACYSAHAPRSSLAKLERILERKVQVQFQSRGGFHQIDLFTDQGTLPLGSLAFRDLAEGQILQILIVEANFQRFGVGEALIEQALLKFPNTQIIDGIALEKVNKRELKKALKTMSPIEALKQTPSYKLKAAFGFTEIIPELITEDFDFAVRKPKQPRPTN